MYFFAALALISFIGSACGAANDWSQPCLSGVCFYDLPSSANGASGTLKIWGSSDSITDITAAAGWEILDCAQDSVSQDIRLVCTGGDNCDHLYKSIGAVGKIARLPESCGKNAFAHISRAWVPQNQRLPENLAKRFAKRGIQPEVKALHIDTDFSALDTAKVGVVNFAIHASNTPGSAAPAPTSRVKQKRQFGFLKKAANKVTSAAKSAVNTAKAAVKSTVQTVKVVQNPVQSVKAAVKKTVSATTTAVKKTVQTAKAAVKQTVKAAKAVAKSPVQSVKAAVKKTVETAEKVIKTTVKGTQTAVKGTVKAVTGVVDKAKNVVEDVVDDAKDAVEGAKDAVEDAVDTVKDAVGDAADAVKGVVSTVVDAAKDINDVDIDETVKLRPFSISRTFNILDEKLSCPPVEARLKVDVTAKATAQATINVEAEGTLIPPKMEVFEITATLTADLDGELNMNGGLSGTIDSGKIKLFEVGIPGLSFPGILTIGPSISIDTQATASLDVNADLTVGINYKVDKATLVFPPKRKGARGQDRAFSLGNTPLKLSVSPSVRATGTLTGHLIPSLNLGITALAGAAEATVFLELDASATMRLTLEGRAEASAAVEGLGSRAELGSAENDIVSRARSNEVVSADEHPSSSALREPGTGILIRQVSAARVPKNSAFREVGTGIVIRQDRDIPAAVSTHGGLKPSPFPEVGTGIVIRREQVDEDRSERPKGSSFREVGTGIVIRQDRDDGDIKPSTSSQTLGNSKVSSFREVGTGIVIRQDRDLADSVAIRQTSVSTGTSSSFGGCFEILAGLDVNAGADASFFGLFDVGDSVSLFSKEFELFKRCFGDPIQRRGLRFARNLDITARAPIALAITHEKRALSCPAAAPAPEALVDQVVSSASVQAK